ncbi:MAG: ribonuclease P protein component [Desulfobulbus propionicus]|nr:MAG: ribonuclease P protein component [Desulfobulbus propionicus]
MKRHGLPKTKLLRQRWEFARVYAKGARLRGEGFSLIFRDNAQPVSRLGISVPRKAGSAVRRNRVKRLFREVFRLNHDLFPAGSDIVVTIRPDFQENSYRCVKQAVARVVTSSGQAGRGLK